jgi:peptide/nickel transport system permease protein
MGRDQLGRSVLGRVVASGRVSLLIAGAAVALSAMIGSAAGLLAGFYRGWVDSVIVRAIEVQMAFPAILLALAIVGVFGSGVLTLIVVFAITGWPVYARTVRSSALVLGSSEMVEAGRAIGQRTWILLSRYILANSVSPVMVILAFDIGRVILSEAALSFLGLGVQPPLPTWGNMIAEGRNYINTAWWLITFPGLAIVLIVFGCSLLADALRDRWDPRA